MNLRVLNSGISSAAARHKEPWHGSLAPSLAKSQRPPVKSKLGARWLLQAGARGVQWVQSWSHGDFIRNPAKGTKNISWILWFYLYHTITDHMSWLYNIICIYIYIYTTYTYIIIYIYIYHIVLGCDILGPFGLISWKKSYTLPLLPSLCASESLSSCQSHCNCSSTTAKEDHILLEPRRNPLRFLPTGVNSGSGNGNGW